MTEPFEIDDALPEPLPADPMAMVRAWLDDAMRLSDLPNPNAMALATVDADGRPSARMVLCKGLDIERGRFTFYTNWQSPKGKAIEHEPRVALLFHFDAQGRQVRVEGPATLASADESDAYFQTRSTESKLAAWASEQSQPIGSRDELLARVVEMMARFDVNFDNLDDAPIPRPPFWGGYHVWAERIELWVGGPGRIHDRGLWRKKLEAGDRSPEGGFVGGAWESTRLQP